MNENNILNISLNEKRKNFQEERVTKLRQVSENDLERDMLLKKKTNNQVNPQHEKDNSYTKNNMNPSLEKYKKEIIGNTNKEKIIPTSKSNNQQKEWQQNQDNSIILKQVYDKQLKMNTQEVKELFNKKNNI